MTFNYEQWEETMVRKHGADWRKVMRERASLGGSVKVPKGFGRMEPGRLNEVATLGGHARQAKGKK